jgi:DMSO/TMAO reductase YedYZ molybdopterin-dependent catalytic subunit
METTPDMVLPPGQHAIDGFPRFGTHLAQAPPAVPADPGIEVTGAGIAPFAVPLAELAALPRTELTADFHCVGGWTATGLRWEGVAFATFYRRVIEPALEPGTPVSHLVFAGLDGFWSVMVPEDAMADDVLIAEHLGGRPLDGDHGAPARLVSPAQYGFVSTKHLCRIELHTSEPDEGYGSATSFARWSLRLVWFKRHPRARVWLEERHRHLPAWSVRLIGRAILPVTAFLSARGSREGETR